MNRKYLFCLVSILVSLVGSVKTSLAQTAAGNGNAPTSFVTKATRAQLIPRLDGDVLKDPAYSIAAPLAEFWQTARSAEHAVEAPFVVSQFSGSLSTGVIDLLHYALYGWSLLDYKTDMAPEAGDYTAQLDGYRKALESCGLRVSSVALQPVRSAKSADDV